MPDQVENVENKNENVNESKVDIYVEKASAMGWKPLEEWNGDEELWVDAKEFVQRKPMLDRISEQSREIKQLTAAIQRQYKDIEAGKKRAYDQAIADLKAQRAEALHEGDARLVVKLEDDIEKIQDEKKQFEEVSREQARSGPSPEFLDFASKNEWYSRDRVMTAFADSLGASLYQSGMSEQEVFKEVHAEIRKRYPEKFGRTTPPASSVATSSKTTRESTKESATDTQWNAFSNEERRVIEKIIKITGQTREEYLSEINQNKKQTA